MSRIRRVKLFSHPSGVQRAKAVKAPARKKAAAVRSKKGVTHTRSGATNVIGTLPERAPLEG